VPSARPTTRFSLESFELYVWIPKMRGLPLNERQAGFYAESREIGSADSPALAPSRESRAGRSLHVRYGSVLGRLSRRELPSPILESTLTVLDLALQSVTSDGGPQRGGTLRSNHFMLRWGDRIGVDVFLVRLRRPDTLAVHAED